MDFLVILVLFLITTYSSDSTTGDINYVFFAFLLLAVILRFWIQGALPSLRLLMGDLLPLALLLLWAYGFILGLLNRNPLEGVVRNFAGMVIFALYYLFLVFRIPPVWIAGTLMLSSWANLGVALNQSLRLVRNEGIAVVAFLGKERLLFSGATLLVFMVQAVLLLSLLMPKERVDRDLIPKLPFLPGRRWVRFLAYWVTLVPIITSFSKGYILAFLFSTLAIPAALFGRGMLKGRIHRGLLVSLMLFGGVGVVGYQLGIGELASQMFAASEVSNETRYEQTTEIVKDMTLFGKGLGATLAGGYSRDDLGYGFEVSYINIFHKFGAFAALLLYAYALVLGRALLNIYRGQALAYSVISVGAMAYLWPSIGNPFLLGSTPNALFCCAFYLLRDASRKEGAPGSSAGGGEPPIMSC